MRDWLERLAWRPPAVLDCGRDADQDNRLHVLLEFKMQNQTDRAVPKKLPITQIFWLPTEFGGSVYETGLREQLLGFAPDCLELFPDGSMQWNNEQREVDVRRFLYSIGIMDKSVWDTPFRALSGFGQHLYFLLYPLKYQKRVGTLNFGPGLRPAQPVVDSEHCLEDIGITVTFRKQPPRDIKLQFEMAVNDWFRVAELQGAIGEGPVIRRSEVVFDEKCARFELDFTRSGQATLNWLMLAMLTFGVSRSVITEVIPCRERQVLIPDS